MSSDKQAEATAGELIQLNFAERPSLAAHAVREYREGKRGLLVTTV